MKAKLSLSTAVFLLAASMGVAHATETPRDARIVHACQDIMGFQPGLSIYASCVVSLQKTMASVDRATLVAQKRTACMDRGLMPGTPEFAHCVVDAVPSLAN